MEKKVQELEEKCFLELIFKLGMFAMFANEKDVAKANLIEDKIKGYLDCMRMLELITHDEIMCLEDLLFDYQISKINER